MSEKYLRTLKTVRGTTAKSSDGDVIEAGLIGAACGAVLGYISAGTLGLAVGVFLAGSGSAGAVALEGIIERYLADETNLQKSVSATKVRMSRNGRASLFNTWNSVSYSSTKIESAPAGKLRKCHMPQINTEVGYHLHKKPDSIAAACSLTPRKTLAHK